MMIFIDHQPQMAFGVTSIDRQQLLNNTVALAKAAQVFQVPVILTTVETTSFRGYQRRVSRLCHRRRPRISWGLTLPLFVTGVCVVLATVAYAMHPASRSTTSVA